MGFRRALLAAGLTCLCLTLPGPALAQEAAPLPVPGTEGLPSLSGLVDRVSPAVVSIAVTSEAPATSNPLFSDPFFRRYFDLPEGQGPQAQPRTRMSAGSGVIIDADEGYVITNHHVVADGQRIAVVLADGRNMNAELVGSDQATDVALLKIDAENLTDIPMRDSSELQLGDFVVAIGNPFGLNQTVTAGIVSALGRSGLNIEGYEDFIQTDASINPGNSGGALIALDGRLVGMNTAILAPAGGNVGIGFAVPTGIITEVTNQLIQYGEVRRGRLGIGIQDLTDDLAAALGAEAQAGAVVASVERGSPAEEAGLEVGDIVVALNGEEVQSATNLRNRIGLTQVGTEIRLTVLREGQEQEIAATIGEPAAQATASARASLEGVEFRDLQSGEGPEGVSQGAVVESIAEGSPASQSGLQVGDIITTVNRQGVANASELEQALRNADGTLALQVIRDGNRMLLVIR